MPWTYQSAAQFSNKHRVLSGAIASGATSDPFVLPYERSCDLQAQPGASGSARFEATYASVDEVAAGTAVWESWALGDVSIVTTLADVSRFTAVRGVAIGAAARFVVAY